jgi:hypothetical protein
MDMIPIHLIAAAASSSSGAPEKTGGMPQISQLAENGFVSSQIFWLLIVFGLVYVVVGRMMATKVVATVEQRDKVVADDLVRPRPHGRRRTPPRSSGGRRRMRRANRPSASWPRLARPDRRRPSSGSARPMPSSMRVRQRPSSASLLRAARR